MPTPSERLSTRAERASGDRASMVELELVDWRRSVARLYADVRDEPAPHTAHAVWREGRDRLFRAHPQSPLPAGDRLRDGGLPYWPYDPSLRFELPLTAAGSPARRSMATGADGVITLRSIGYVQLPAPLSACVNVWWLEQYGGGLFLPLRDRTAGKTSYGGGRYLLDTAKGADLGSADSGLIIDLNFLYHPSCRYNERWECPLPPPENAIGAEVEAGEKLG